MLFWFWLWFSIETKAWLWRTLLLVFFIEILWILLLSRRRGWGGDLRWLWRCWIFDVGLIFTHLTFIFWTGLDLSFGLSTIRFLAIVTSFRGCARVWWEVELDIWSFWLTDLSRILVLGLRGLDFNLPGRRVESFWNLLVRAWTWRWWVPVSSWQVAPSFSFLNIKT